MRRFAHVLAACALAAGCGGAGSSPAPMGGAGGHSTAGGGGRGGGPGGGGAGGAAGAGTAGTGSAATGGGAGGASGAASAGSGGAGAGAGAAGAAGSAGRGGATGASGAAGTTAGRGGASGAAGAGAAGRGGASGGAGAGGAPATVETLDVTDVWSGHPVAFSLVTRGDQQLAAFFDADRRMTVAQRTLGTATWRLTRLDNTLGWDSHNYVTMAIDGDGFVHVSGNMHNVPLIYYRSTRALDASSLARASMVGSNEQSVTYPEFFAGPDGNLVFIYRDGGSGNGNHIFNTYDAAARAWRRLLSTPLTDGQGQRNAYPVGPVLGPDGFYHLVWVWRDTPDAATNHDLSYAKSRDLVTWQSAAGTALTLPITLARSDIVDPVPSGGGMINNNTKVGFDSQNRAVVVYHKYDSAGNTQLYNARFEGGRWVRYQTSMWSYRWAFGGGGTLVFEIEVAGVKAQPDGTLTQDWYHARNGGWGAFRLDESNLRAIATIERPLPYPRALDAPQSPTAGMVVRWAADTGAGPDPNVRYLLRWETLESNRDMPRDPIPPATRLRLYGFQRP
jgi:hypothetical protein